MKKLVLVAGVLTLLPLGGAANAQRYTQYPVCAVYGGFSSRVVSCAFNNFAQCQMSISGRGGFCEPNPDYRPAARKRIRRDY